MFNSPNKIKIKKLQGLIPDSSMCGNCVCLAVQGGRYPYSPGAPTGVVLQHENVWDNTFVHTQGALM